MQWVVIFDDPGSFTQKEFSGDSDGRFRLDLGIFTIFLTLRAAR